MLLFILSATPAFADGQGQVFLPDFFIALIYIVWGLLIIGLGTVISFLFRTVYERTRGEKRTTVLWMILFTVAIPVLAASFMDLESLYRMDGLYNRPKGVIIYRSVLSLCIFIGFNIGYYVTPKLPQREVVFRTIPEQIKAVLIQLFFWCIPGLIFYLSIRRELKANERINTFRYGIACKYVESVGQDRNTVSF